MAITNAQQFKQLLANGGRIGLRGGGADMGAPDKAADREATGYGGSGLAASSGPTNNQVDTGDLGSEAANVRANIAANLGGSGRADPQQAVQTLQRFLNTRKNINVPTLFGQFFKKPIQKFADFTSKKNRDFFQKVIGAGKLNLGGKTIDLETIGLMDDDELEKTYQDYMTERLAGRIDAYGNRLNIGDDRGQTLPIIPQTIANMTDDAADADADEKENVGRMFRLLADGGMTEDAPVGGIMDIESGRQMYGLGKLVKKATRAVKKIVKSPIGKAALVGAGFGFAGMGPFKGLSGTKFGLGLKDFLAFGNVDKAFNIGSNAFKFGNFLTTPKGIMTGIAALSAAPLLFGKQEEDDEENMDRGPKLEIDRIRANPYLFTPRRFAAEGGSMKEPVAKKTMPLIDMDGKEKDYRETGGFVDMGRMERADDVPARLSKNEFVFTADAVRNAGDGSVDKGAEVMYNMMKNLESGGDVSEESQGLDGARKMFQTSQRLGEVL